MNALLTSSLILVLLGGIVPITFAQDAPSTWNHTSLGTIVFPTSGPDDAQPYFLRGVLLLHSFQYDDAKEAFQQAQAIDPNFAMAYWGEAMTENHPLWGEQNLEEARAILSRLSDTHEGRLSKAQTEREKGYLQAIEGLYGEGTKESRNQAYAQAMQQLVEQFPEDLEASAFYALALLGSAQGVRDDRIYMKAASIAEGVFQRHPRHPGAVHYLIHSYDDPIHAPLGLRAANIYASIAPAAAHAQHMPSHIFMALGMWDKVVQANETAWAASETRRKIKGLSIGDRPYHTLYWLEYAYLQQGKFQKAKQLLALIEDDAQIAPSRYTRGYLASMRATYIIETQQWNTDAYTADRSGLRYSAAVSELFAVGFSAAHTNNWALVETVHRELHNRTDPKTHASQSQDGVGGWIMAQQLEALLVLNKGNTQRALQLLKEAAQEEENMPYDYGPPYPIKPSHELLGEVLLSLDKPIEAQTHFQQALSRTTNRTLSKKGLLQATRSEKE
ncbi:MAG: tetratricopeptide repeat protein [Nitrospirae bacterium]|nr:tetratricopeptide repeat protein [Nitrospirota bacterium]